jgi:DNA polymerase II
MKGYIVYSTYSTEGERTIIQLFGKLENGQSFLTLNKIEPYFYVRKKDAKKSKLKTTPTNLANFNLEQVVKASFKTKTEQNNAFKKIYKDIDVYEADIRPHYRFLMDNNILGTVEIEGDHQPSDKIDRIYNEPKITPADYKPKLKIISIDIETGKPGKLFCIGLTGEKYKKNFMITKQKLDNTVSCKDEADCLEKFKEELLKQDPDIITGWNVIDFDFNYLKERFRANEIRFDLGRSDEEIRLRIESGFFRSSSIDIQGRQILDGLSLIRDPFIRDSPAMKNTKLNSLTLEDVSQEILGKGKLLKGRGRHKEIEDLYQAKTKQSHQKLVNYNIMDCELVYDILEKTDIVNLAVQRSLLTGMPLDRITGSIAAFDSLYIREANSRGLVSPTLHYKPKEERITGGYVQNSLPGVYKNVLVLDFKSLYPSIIRTFNIDPSSFLERKTKGTIESPNKAYFKNQEGILPIIIERLHKEREKAKKENNMYASHAIKIIMNSFFGVLASPNCRFFSLKMANAITHFGQFLIKLTAKEIEKEFKHKTIYSDTDSVFIETGLGKQKAHILGSKIESHINNFYEKYTKKEHNRNSFLELEFEKQYLYLMLPKVRGKGSEEKSGAKKRYAGLLEKNGKEKLEIVGLEAIRGDWTEAAQDFQKEILMKLFHEEPIDKFVRSYIKKIEDGKLDEKLIYRKSIRKALEEYTKTTPPHVKAARKLPKLESNKIEYYITLDGPEPIQRLKHKIDYDHYIEKQIKPIANQVLNLFDKEFDDISKGSKQTKLF